MLEKGEIDKCIECEAHLCADRDVLHDKCCYLTVRYMMSYILLIQL